MPHELDYATPAASATGRRIASVVGRLAVLAGLCFGALVLPVPFPQGIWYFGHRPQWIVAIDSAGLTVGPSDQAVTLGYAPLFVMKMALVMVPVWFVRRFTTRNRRKAPPA